MQQKCKYRIRIEDRGKYNNNAESICEYGGKGCTTHRGREQSPAASDIQWTVTPSAHAHITTGNGQAMILFTETGTYLIKARYVYGVDSTDSVSSPIAVTDSCYKPTPPTTTDTSLLTGSRDHADAIVRFAGAVTIAGTVHHAIRLLSYICIFGDHSIERRRGAHFL